MSESAIEDWVSLHPLEPIHVDCATAVMLKILDGKCKMAEDEKKVMAALYDAVKAAPGKLLDRDMHTLIASATPPLDEQTKMLIYEKRLLAETMISRPVMKAFKAMIRHNGLFENSMALAG